MTKLRCFWLAFIEITESIGRDLNAVGPVDVEEARRTRERNRERRERWGQE